MQSFQAFAALLTRDGFDCSFHASWLFSSALEYPLASENPAGGTSDPKSQRSSGAAFESVVAAVAYWIAQCGGVIYEHSKEGSSGTNQAGPLWDGKAGFSTPRYQLWKRRFGEIGRNEEVEKSIRDLAARAALQMEDLER